MKAKTGSVDDAMVATEVVLGRKSLSVGELSRAGKGTVIVLDSLAGEPVEFVAAGVVVARGEVIVAEENFGIRLTELVEAGR